MKQKGKEAKKYIQANQAGGGTLYQKKTEKKSKQTKRKRKEDKKQERRFSK